MLPFRDYNPSRTFPIVTISIIILNVLVMLYMVRLAQIGELQEFVFRAAVIPAAFTKPGYSPPVTQLQPEFLTVFTAMFMHGGLLHLAGNMLYLWIFGNNIEDIMGSGRFLLFYLLCGVIATVAHIAVDPGSGTPVLGASGAIAGVLGAYLVRFPRAQVDTCVFAFVVFIIRLPALVVLAFWFILQFFQGTLSLLASDHAPSVAYWAHIGGFVAGMIFVTLFAKRPNPRYNG
ncbi:MAG: rhomboid family intramembrane serine protease [Armatimonadota bacterium]